MATDLATRDLGSSTFRAAAYPVRPIDGLNPRRIPVNFVLLLGAKRLWEDDASLGARRDPHADVGVGAHRRHRGDESPRLVAHEVPALTRRDRVPGVQSPCHRSASFENVMVLLRGVSGVGRPRLRADRAPVSAPISAHRLTHCPGGMSGGQQQRVVIARALAHDPPVILDDETTAQLDFIQVEAAEARARALADDGRFVVVATHDERLIPLADAAVNLTPRRYHRGSRSREPRRADQVLFKQAVRGGPCVHGSTRARSRSCAPGRRASRNGWP